MADKQRINGNQYDFGSVSLKIADEPIYGFTSLSWSQKRERAKGYGAGKDRTPKGQTGGRVTYEPLKIKVRRDTANEIKLLLAAAASDGQSYGNAAVPVVAQWVEDETNQLPHTVEFFDCTYQSESPSTEEEGGADEIEIEFSYMKLDETIAGKKVTLYDATGS